MRGAGFADPTGRWLGRFVMMRNPLAAERALRRAVQEVEVEALA